MQTFTGKSTVSRSERKKKRGDRLVKLREREREGGREREREGGRERERRKNKGSRKVLAHKLLLCEGTTRGARSVERDRGSL